MKSVPASARRAGRSRHADSGSDRLQRRVRADSADAEAARGGGPADAAGRRAGAQAGAHAAAILPQRGGDGSRLSGDERSVWTAVPGEPRRGGYAGAGRRAREATSPGSSSSTVTPTSCATTPAWRASCACARRSARPAGTRPWSDKPQSIEDLKFDNYFKEVFLDSDTKIAIISSAPSEVPEDWFLTNQMTAQARARVNEMTGSRRMLSHAIFTPGSPVGWRRWTVPSSRTSRTPSRATRSATTRTRTSAGIPGAWTTRSACIRSTSGCGRPTSATSACTRGCFRHRSRSSTRTCASTATCATWAARRRTGRCSTSSSITPPIAFRAGARPRRRWRSSSRPAASNG